MSWIHIGMHVWIHIELILICPMVKRKGKESTFTHCHHIGRGKEGIRVRVRVVVKGRVVPGERGSIIMIVIIVDVGVSVVVGVGIIVVVVGSVHHGDNGTHNIIYLKKKERKKVIEVLCETNCVGSYRIFCHDINVSVFEPNNGMGCGIPSRKTAIYWLRLHQLRIISHFSHDLPNGSRKQSPNNKRNTTDLPTQSIRDSYILYKFSPSKAQSLKIVRRKIMNHVPWCNCCSNDGDGD
jgi:hypothetical protein